MAAILKTLWDLSAKLGITEKKDTIEEQINTMNKALGTKMGNNIEEGIRYYKTDVPSHDITDVDPATVTTPTISTVYGHNVSDLQEDIAIDGNAITGTLKYTDEGSLPDYWGVGYFIVLKFTNFPAGTTACYAGLEPSRGSGLGDVYEDSDHTLVAKVSDKNEQRIKVITCIGGDYVTKYYDLSGLAFTGYTPPEE